MKTLKTTTKVPELIIALPSRVNRMVTTHADKYGVTPAKIVDDLVCREFHNPTYPNLNELSRLVEDRFDEEGWECLNAIYDSLVRSSFTRNLRVNELPTLAKLYGCNEKLLAKIVDIYGEVNEDGSFVMPFTFDDVVRSQLEDMVTVTTRLTESNNDYVDALAKRYEVSKLEIMNLLIGHSKSATSPFPDTGEILILAEEKYGKEGVAKVNRIWELLKEADMHKRLLGNEFLQDINGFDPFTDDDEGVEKVDEAMNREWNMSLDILVKYFDWGDSDIPDVAEIESDALNYQIEREIDSDRRLLALFADSETNLRIRIDGKCVKINGNYNNE